jgi:catechol 2,3-dioxygenase-like lactoylglutathione lyase family enzyme
MYNESDHLKYKIPSHKETMSRAMNHVAVSVTDMDRAVKWYKDIMGFTLIMGPVEISTEPADTDIAKAASSIFGTKLKKMLLCHMSSANGVGFEIFQFVEPKAELRKDNFEYWKNGFFHICVTDPEIEKLAKRIASSGGRQRSDIFELVPGSGHRICFCEDPFGNIIEIYTHSYEQNWSNLTSR